MNDSRDAPLKPRKPSESADTYFTYNPGNESFEVLRKRVDAAAQEQRERPTYQSHRIEFSSGSSPHSSEPAGLLSPLPNQAQQTYHKAALALNDGSEDIVDVSPGVSPAAGTTRPAANPELSAQISSYQRAQKLAKKVKIISPKSLRDQTSNKYSRNASLSLSNHKGDDVDLEDSVGIGNAMTSSGSRVRDGDVSPAHASLGRDDSDDDEGIVMAGPRIKSDGTDETLPHENDRGHNEYIEEARRLVRTYKGVPQLHPGFHEAGQERVPGESIPYKPSIYSQLKKVHHMMSDSLKTARSASNLNSWHSDHGGSWTNFSRGRGHYPSISGASTRTTSPIEKDSKSQRPVLKRVWSSGIMNFRELLHHKKELGDRHINISVADTLARQDLIITLCRAFIETGVPTHRLEEIMKVVSDMLLIRADFLYIPGCMMISFDDPDNGQSLVRLVKISQAINLGKLKDVHDVYQRLKNDKDGNFAPAEAVQELKTILAAPPLIPAWIVVLLYGAASAFVGPFAFNARLVDLPICFLFGLMVGLWAEVIAKRYPIWGNVYEVLSAMLTSLLARFIGSFENADGVRIFCFSAIAQSSIALILPGFTILCGVLELLNFNMTAGSVRMVYAIIKALLLGFGITVGTAMIGRWKGATSDVTCAPTWDWWDRYTVAIRLVSVILFTLCLMLINQVNLKQRAQCAAMLGIAMIGYETTYWSSVGLGNAQVANAIGAFTIGLITCIYTTAAKGMAAAAILPAIFVQVPSGLAASGSLVSGITSANQISGNGTGTTVVTNGTEGFAAAQNASLGQDNSLQHNAGGMVYTGTISNIGIGMVQIALGISGGLFVAVAVFYSLKVNGKKRGLFTF